MADPDRFWQNVGQVDSRPKLRKATREQLDNLENYFVEVQYQPIPDHEKEAAQNHVHRIHREIDRRNNHRLTILSLLITGLIGIALTWWQIRAGKQPTLFGQPSSTTSTASSTLAQSLVPLVPTPSQTVGTLSSTPIPTPPPTPTPTPIVTPIPTATPTLTPTPTPTATWTPNPTPTVPLKVPPPPFNSSEGAEQPQIKKAPRFKLGPILVDVEGVKNATSNLQVFVEITNASNTNLFVFAGSPDPIGASWRQLPSGVQALTGRGSDNKNSTFWLQSLEGFTRVPDKYFVGENIYIELGPKESAKASFLLANNWLTGPELGNAVNVSIEFAIVSDLRSTGSHQTRALTLTKWPLD